MKPLWLPLPVLFASVFAAVAIDAAAPVAAASRDSHVSAAHDGSVFERRYRGEDEVTESDRSGSSSGSSGGSGPSDERSSSSGSSRVSDSGSSGTSGSGGNSSAGSGSGSSAGSGSGSNVSRSSGGPHRSNKRDDSGDRF